MIQAPIIISGPTGSGKSELAHRIAGHFAGEIVNADSVQLYAEHDIGAAMPKSTYREQLPYHLFGTLSGAMPCDVQSYVHAACGILQDVQSRGVMPVLVGGSTLYLEGLLAGISRLPASKPELRKELEREEVEELHKRLETLDPERAEALHPNDRIRIIRALEVCLVSGKSYSELCKQEARIQHCRNATVIVPVWSRSDLYRRIEKRSQRMVANGIIEEARYLFGCYGSQWQCQTALGYKQVFERLISRHSVSEEAHREIVREISQATRRYAKRQMTYWRNAPQKFEWNISPSIEEHRQEQVQILAEDSGIRGAAGERRKGFHVWRWSSDELIEALEKRWNSSQIGAKDSGALEAEGHVVWFVHAGALEL